MDDFKPIELTDAQGIDYFENLCLEAENSCADERTFSPPRIGVPDQKIALHVNVHFYTDKELMVSSDNSPILTYFLPYLLKFSGKQRRCVPESL